MTRSHATLRAIIALGLVVGVACQAAAPSGTAAPGTAAAGTGAATAAPKPTPVTAEKLTYVQAATVDSLDPHQTRRNEGFGALINIHEGLFTRDLKTMEPKPLLATSWQTPNPQTWIFKLRSGVKFHNGEDFNADVVKYNFDRVREKDLNSTIGATLDPIIDKVTVNDPTTVTITTKVPAPWLLERIARLWMVPMKESKEKGKDYVSKNPVGTGPYKFVEWVNAQRVVMERNDAYWGEKPAYKQIVMREIIETSTAIAELIAGSVDIIALVPPDQVKAVNDSKIATVKSVQTQAVYEVALDALARGGQTPWTNKKVRQAANHAVDREAIAKNLMGGFSQPVANFLNPVIFGYDASVKPYAYDLNKAKQLMTEAGFANGFNTEIKVFPLGQAVDSKVLAEAVANDLGKIGIKASIRQVSSAEIGPLVREGKAGPAYIRQHEAASSFDAALAFSFIRKGSVFAYYSDDKLEDLRVKAESTVDRNERLRLYKEIQQFVSDEAPMIFGWSGFVLTGVNNKVDWSPSADAATRLYLAKPKS